MCVCFFFSTNWRKDKDAIARTPEHQNVLKIFFQLCKFSWFDFHPGLSEETSDNLKVFRELGSHMAQKYFLSGRRKRTYCENNASISFDVRVREGKWIYITSHRIMMMIIRINYKPQIQRPCHSSQSFHVTENQYFKAMAVMGFVSSNGSNIPQDWAPN